ncbi:4Fe-4S dicluster domain-containing protein [Thermanaeromonas sp. C210]|uniref:4Fe-4S dicluster domain-containing protein n=1 Tax=Thermanaeromonas sp. C210 TaxID=2731925 RepID=UPI00155D4784|nr:4Fe-4S dicluster domain-containing protein [Thermanaeromonas sp. C210]GFN22939.1 4Fe-4S ferredoxin [Thermanaeromonas sp. C210]
MALGFLLDLSRCTGCRACETACRYEHGGVLAFRRVQRVERQVAGTLQLCFLSLACNHCEHPECFRVCPQRAYSKRRDGVVLHSPGRCNGCNTCIRACPFQAPRYNPLTGKTGKCDLCVHRLDAGLSPACIEACPVKALHLLDLRAEREGVWQRWVYGLSDVSLTRPSLRFKINPAGRRYFARRPGGLREDKGEGRRRRADAG